MVNPSYVPLTGRVERSGNHDTNSTPTLSSFLLRQTRLLAVFLQEQQSLISQVVRLRSSSSRIPPSSLVSEAARYFFPYFYSCTFAAGRPTVATSTASVACWTRLPARRKGMRYWRWNAKRWRPRRAREEPDCHRGELPTATVEEGFSPGAAGAAVADPPAPARQSAAKRRRRTWRRCRGKRRRGKRDSSSMCL